MRISDCSSDVCSSDLRGVVSQAMIIRAYRSGEASFVAPFDYLQLILAGLIGFAVFGEVPGPATLLGAVVIVGAAVYTARREAAQAPARPATSADRRGRERGCTYVELSRDAGAVNN